MEWKLILPIAALQIILMIFALVDLIRREKTRVRGPKWLWAVVSVFIGTIGPISYFVIGRRD
jgi:hypothetical protein